MADVVQFRYTRFGFSLTIYPTRIEVQQGIFPFKRRTTLSIRQIASCDVTGGTHALQITTTAGRRYTYGVGFTANKAQTILSTLLS